MIKVTEGTPEKAILIKESEVITNNLTFYYGNNYVCYGIPSGLKAKERKEFIEQINDILEPVKVVLVADSEMFKSLTKEKGADGVVVDTVLGKAFKIPNYLSIMYDPAQAERLKFIMEKVNAYINTGTNSEIGSDIIHNAKYSTTGLTNEIVDELLTWNACAIDIETTGLKFYKDKMISIAFGKDIHNGIATTISQKDYPLLKKYFLEYKGKKIFHNASFDTMFIIHECFMSGLEDWDGMLTGLHCVFNNLEDTKVIAYLALNTTGKANLKLKYLAYQYTGDYAQDDIDSAEDIPLERLLPYNLTDVLATWYVYNTYYPKMVEDQQEELYKTLMLPSLKVLTQTQLVGMRMDEAEINTLDTFLNSKEYSFRSAVLSNPIVKEFEYKLKERNAAEYNKTHKKKQKTIEDFKTNQFNIASGSQLGEFLYDFLGLPVLSYTDKGNPAVDGDTLQELVVKAPDGVKDILKNIYEYSKVRKIITAFLKNFIDAPLVNGRKALYGNFNLCGTRSGRLSSSGPNLQQLPSTGSPYAKPVKKIFCSLNGYIFVGADQRSLEDRISALTTKDSQKLKVYTDSFDGHCLRAYSYFKEQMPDVTKELEANPEKEVEIINSIKKRYPELRQASKGITFALTYAGTHFALVTECGLSEEQAIQAEQRYHELYKESDAWVKNKIDKAKEDGYATLAFGLRLRTPLLKGAVSDGIHGLRQAAKERRTVGNALGQSWCLLNSRSANEVMEKVWNSKYKTDILPVAQIHDALYFFVKDDLDVIEWFNKVLIKAMEWQEHPDIAHDQVKLGGDLEIFYPNWSHGTEIPNNATKEQIIEVIRESKK